MPKNVDSWSILPLQATLVIHIKTFLLFNAVFGVLSLMIMDPQGARIVCVGVYFFGGFKLMPWLSDMVGINPNNKVGIVYLLVAPLMALVFAAYFGFDIVRL